jgi:hypothetical protein
MAKRTGIKNNTDTIDIENITGLDNSTVQIIKQPPKKRSWGRKKPRPKAPPAALSEAQDEGINETPGVSEPEEESAATVLPPEDFTLSDFIQTVLDLEPVLEKEPVLERKPASKRGRKPKNATNSVSKKKTNI